MPSSILLVVGLATALLFILLTLQKEVDTSCFYEKYEYNELDYKRSSSKPLPYKKICEE